MNFHKRTKGFDKTVFSACWYTESASNLSIYKYYIISRQRWCWCRHSHHKAEPCDNELYFAPCVYNLATTLGELLSI